MVSNGDVRSIKIWDEKRHPNSRGTQTQRLLHRVPAHFTDHSHWFRVQGSLDHSLGTHATTRCTGNARCGIQISTVMLLSLKFTRGEFGGRHIQKHTHSPTTTRIRANGDIRQFYRTLPNGRLVNIVGICTAPAWRNTAFGHEKHAERKGKLEFKAYWNFRGKEG